MTKLEYFSYIVDGLHTAIMATVDENGLPVTAAMDIMHYDEVGLYFLTAKGKGIYDRLLAQEYMSFTAVKGEDTMHSVAVTVSGNVMCIGKEKIDVLLEKNPYMYDIYPTEEAREALEVFCIYAGKIEWFDLSKKPIERETITFGEIAQKASGYHINESCIACGVCQNVCPQNCININISQLQINAKNCIGCGQCAEICPMGAVEKL